LLGRLLIALEKHEDISEYATVLSTFNSDKVPYHYGGYSYVSAKNDPVRHHITLLN